MAVDALIVNVPTDGDGSGVGFVRGDIVTIRETGWQWGTQEHPATRTREPTDRFVIITVDGLTEEEMRFVLAPWTEGGDEQITVAKRVARLDFNKLTQAQRDQLDATGLITISVNNINNLRQLMQQKDG